MKQTFFGSSVHATLLFPISPSGKPSFSFSHPSMVQHSSIPLSHIAFPFPPLASFVCVNPVVPSSSSSYWVRGESGNFIVPSPSSSIPSILSSFCFWNGPTPGTLHPPLYSLADRRESGTELRLASEFRREAREDKSEVIFTLLLTNEVTLQETGENARRFRTFTPFPLLSGISPSSFAPVSLLLQSAHEMDGGERKAAKFGNISRMQGPGKRKKSPRGRKEEVGERRTRGQQ